ncbi:competence protein ComK [Virgibacillus halophilus]|uniref:Competence protein ComK n=1 Tax=Tigheibacillus halophilus TaxID=361280 RepID=A0ABU5C4S4_9BACI|nr:competence protein ComK [Virgibacillus halophilus]
MQTDHKSVYIITEHTKAILASRSAYYRATVLEGKHEIHSIYTPEMILDHSCILYGSTLSGRRKAIREYYGITSKIPFMIDAKKSHLYASYQFNQTQRLCLAFFLSNRFL